MARRASRRSAYSLENQHLVRLWLLRILIDLGRHRNFIQTRCLHNDALAEELGLGHWIDASRDEFDPNTVLAELRALHREVEKQSRNAKPPACLSLNVKRLSGLVGLSEIDCRILEFAVLIQNERLLDETADWIGHLSSAKVFHALSVILDLPEENVRSALSPNGVLARSGLVSVSRSAMQSLRDKLDLISDTFADLMTSSESDPVTLLRGTVSLAAPGHLHIGDYGHIQKSLDLVRPYLRHAMDTGRAGVNIYIHGAPGTGKTQLARVVAAELGCELFEVSGEDADGNPADGERRLRAFRAAQSFFAKRRALIVFDEVEDVFNDGDNMFAPRSAAQVRKAWINRTLEENAVPTLWLSNSIRGLDRAFIRRFDMVFELPVPPRSQRRQIILAACDGLIESSSAARIAEVESLAPAVVAKAASVVRAIGDQLAPDARAKALEHLIGNTLEAQRHNGFKQYDPNRLPDHYDPAFIHADADLAQLAEGLVRSRSGRLCLYGPPGTGKTAYGRWLAEQLEMPLRVKRASDLLSPFIGECEINIARAFREAERENALLLIDEVDSFLQDRQGASRSWELTQVNEMLTQMESFAGVLIASTNLMDGLDQAALRRFDLKVKFDFLKADQALELLRRHCTQLGLELPDAAGKLALSRLKNLTPGDFAAALRQHRFRPLRSAQQLIEALHAECAIKGGSRPPIGFLHAAPV